MNVNRVRDWVFYDGQDSIQLPEIKQYTDAEAAQINREFKQRNKSIRLIPYQTAEVVSGIYSDIFGPRPQTETAQA